ncbi:MAG: cytochrome P450 [Candidatus Nitrosopolaris sp.]
MKRSSVCYPPGPAQKLPLILFLNFLRNPIEILIDISKYGDISHIKFGTQHVYFLNHPDYIRDVLITYNNSFIKSRGLQVAKKVLGEGLLTSEGNTHRNQRQLIQPAFNQDRLRIYAAIMVEFILRMSNHWRDNDVLDSHKEFMQLTLTIVCKALFGFDIESETEGIGKHVTTLVEYFNRARMPLSEVIEKLPLPSNRHFRSAKKQLDALIYRMIDDHQSADITNGTGAHSRDNHHHDNLISILLARSGNHFISDSQLRDNVMTIFLAGHETVANALTWTFYLLSLNNREEKKLHDEADCILGNDAIPTAADIPKLEYTGRVFTESMRLYPPAWAVGRQAIHDCKVGEYTIPAGSTVLMSQYLMHRDPRFFPEPERFNPDRWNSETRTNLPRFSYFPFGGGPRACIGEPFAWTEGILSIAIIARKWKMKLESGHPIGVKPLVTLRPKYGMRMKLIRRIR